MIYQYRYMFEQHNVSATAPVGVVVLVSGWATLVTLMVVWLWPRHVGQNKGNEESLHAKT